MGLQFHNQHLAPAFKNKSLINKLGQEGKMYMAVLHIVKIKLLKNLMSFLQTQLQSEKMLMSLDALTKRLPFPSIVLILLINLPEKLHKMLL